MQGTLTTDERRLTIDEFIAEYAERPGKFEFVDGQVVTVFDPLAPLESGEVIYERPVHGIVKKNIAMALTTAVRATGVPLVVFSDGMTVETGRGRSRSPDAVAILRSSYDPTRILITEPVFLCEVLSPSTERVDTVVKLREYFEVPTVRSYLVVDPMDQIAVLHRRAGGEVVTSTVREGTLILPDLVDGFAPITVELAQFWIE